MSGPNLTDDAGNLAESAMLKAIGIGADLAKGGMGAVKDGAVGGAKMVADQFSLDKRIKRLEYKNLKATMPMSGWKKAIENARAAAAAGANAFGDVMRNMGRNKGGPTR